MQLPSAPRWQRASFAVLVLVYVAHAWQYGDWLIDDAGITFAYAKNIAAGHGPVVNVGESPVEGYSNPSWTFLISALYGLGIFEVPLAPKILGGLCTVAAMVYAWRASRRAWGAPSSPAHLLAPAFMALVPTFVKYTMSGLENGIFVLAIVAAFDAQLRERERPGWAGGIWTFLTVLGRPEGIAYAFVLGLDRVVNAGRRRDASTLWPWAAGLLGPLVLYAAWHAATFADPLPNTYYAKVAEERGLAEYLSPHDGGNRYLRSALSDHWLYWALIAAALPLLRPRRWLGASGLALYGALGVAFTFPLYAGGDWMPQHRLLQPMYPLLALAAAGGLTAFRWGSIATGVALVLTIATVPSALERAVATRGMRLDVQMKVLDVYGKWADQLGLDHAVIALADLGGSSMTTTPRFELMDLNGLIDRRIAHLLHNLPETGPDPLRDYVFREKRPHFVNYPEAIWRRYQLDGYAPAQDWWLVNSVDPQERFGTYVRKDLLEGELPEGFGGAAIMPGLLAEARLQGGELTIWWVASGTFDKNPQATLTWHAADATELRADTIKPFSGTFGWKILRPGRVLRERWRGTVPPGATEARIHGAQVTVPIAVAAAATGAPVVTAPPPATPGGTVTFESSDWTAIPHDAAGWAFEADPTRPAGGLTLRVDLGDIGPLVCSAWAPIPPTVRVEGQVRGEAVTRGDKPWKSGAATLRVKRADGTQHFPTLATFEGTFAWRSFTGEYKAGADDREYRLCVGSTGGRGRMWADDLVIR